MISPRSAPSSPANDLERTKLRLTAHSEERVGGIFVKGHSDLVRQPNHFNLINQRAHVALAAGDLEDGAGIIGEVLLLSHRDRLDAAVGAGSHLPKQADI